ncbi:MAG TPA: hypothetical protein PKE04_01840, partial [Clostridia bacterium]|nr:hypothetical protein [Clostridia bacterium]
MFEFLKKKRDLSAKVEAFNQGLSDLHVSAHLKENVELMKRLFQDVDITRYKEVAKDGRQTYVLVYSDGVVNSAIINDNILRPLMC